LVPSVCCSRGVSRRVKDFAVCRTAFRASARFKSRSEVSSDSTIGPSWFQPSPFDVRRFQPRPSGFLAAPSCRWVSRHRRSFLQVLRLLEAVHSSTAPEWPDPGAPLLQSCPLQRSTETGARITRRVPTAGTVRPQGFSPSRRLASPATMAGLFHPACVLGVEPGPPLLARTFRSRQGRCARVSSSRLSLPPRRARFGVLSSRALRPDPRRRGISVILFPVKKTKPPDGCCRVSIAESSVYPKVANQGHQPS